MMFLQRVVNGGGFIDREYAIGSGRIDLLGRKPYGDHLLQRAGSMLIPRGSAGR